MIPIRRRPARGPRPGSAPRPKPGRGGRPSGIEGGSPGARGLPVFPRPLLSFDQNKNGPTEAAPGGGPGLWGFKKGAQKPQMSQGASPRARPNGKKLLNHRRDAKPISPRPRAPQIPTKGKARISSPPPYFSSDKAPLGVFLRIRPLWAKGAWRRSPLTLGLFGAETGPPGCLNKQKPPRALGPSVGKKRKGPAQKLVFPGWVKPDGFLSRKKTSSGRHVKRRHRKFRVFLSWKKGKVTFVGAPKSLKLRPTNIRAPPAPEKAQNIKTAGASGGAVEWAGRFGPPTHPPLVPQVPGLPSPWPLDSLPRKNQEPRPPFQSFA